ncbi:sugar O-acetyltransferase [Demequina zhanjiangensis]|uniref:Sugar O-acetyltransferase n=1 Tax=Demequina zhanjiangensis TaxID=3051659 RepID=A0ABT8FXG0_9MICO|nr:sugar O-acetyltransferase [Demequina sp. SYSU T00b26]MDN4471585.1 sugar O-acetyltransferase [Demequina sp. SYSU T00b26]
MTATLDDLLAALRAGEMIPFSSDLQAVMSQTSQAALRLTGRLNSGYHEPADVRAILSELFHYDVDESVTLLPPFHTEFGPNTRIGKRVFLNIGCTFQDQGGVTIGDDSFLGHHVTIVTQNHDLAPERRGDLYPAPVTLGKGVWVGSNATILPGVTVGDHAVIGAASVVTKDVPARTIVAGSPARVIRSIDD